MLHYVISARDLKPQRAWRPDPLGSHAASLFLASAASNASTPQASFQSDREAGGMGDMGDMSAVEKEDNEKIEKCNFEQKLSKLFKPVYR